jgi:hypothetical protein
MNRSLAGLALSLLALALWFMPFGAPAGILPVALDGKVPTLAPLVRHRQSVVTVSLRRARFHG